MTMENEFQKVHELMDERILVIWVRPMTLLRGANFQGDEDKIVPYSLVPRVKKLLPSADFLIVENATHAVLTEYPESTSSKILEFIK